VFLLSLGGFAFVRGRLVLPVVAVERFRRTADEAAAPAPRLNIVISRDGSYQRLATSDLSGCIVRPNSYVQLPFGGLMVPLGPLRPAAARSFYLVRASSVSYSFESLIGPHYSRG
jgi:hypothetical protein